MWLISLVYGYFFGMIHGAKLAEWITGVNLKEVGTKNYGASNAMLSLGIKWGIIVALVDMGKAALAVIIAKQFLFDMFYIVDSNTSLYVVLLGLFLGHNFSVFMVFRGGKGTAILMSGSIAIHPEFGLAAVLLFVVIAIMTNYLVYGLFVFYGLILWNAWLFAPTVLTFISVGLILFIGCILHCENWRHIRAGTEPKFRDSFKKST